MIFGVGFYSFVIGNLTSMIANENADSENLYVRLGCLINIYLEQVESIGRVCEEN